MTIGRGIKLVVMLTVAAVLGASRAEGQQPTTTADTMAPASQPAMQTLEQLTGVLNGPQSRQEERDEAARRLVARRTPEARKVVTDAIKGILAQPQAQLAAVKALADDPQPDRELLTPLMTALDPARGSPALATAAVRALINYRDDPDVFVALGARIVNRGTDAAIRREMIRVLGSFVEARSAALLIELLRSGDESPLNKEAAMDALVDLTGLTENSRDPARWLAWWEQNRNRPDAEFRTELLIRRSARLDQVRLDLADANAALSAALRDRYLLALQAGPAQKLQRLLEYLRSPRAQVRAFGASLVQEDFVNTVPIPPEVRAQLRLMVGDSSARVRRGVAQALQINDSDSFEALLAQLTIEPDTQVRMELLRAIAPIKNVRAVPELLKHLKDPNIAVVREAVKALEWVAPSLRDQDPPLAQQTAVALRDNLAAIPATPANADLREELVEAMVPLRQAILLQNPLTHILREQANEAYEMRRLAVKAIGELGIPESQPTIQIAIEDPDHRVRQEAVVALGKLQPSVENVPTLRRRLDPAVESDESVRSAAWTVLENMLPSLTKEQLQDLADRFKSEPPRRIAVLKALATKLDQQGLGEELADVRYNIGRELLNDPNTAGELDPKTATDAAPFLEKSLEYKRSQPNPQEVSIEGLTRDLMRALLRSGTYDKAVTLAADSIRKDVKYQPLMGSSIRAEAEYLRTGGKVEEALKLIAQTKQMNPKLDEQYLNWLADFERWAIQQRDLRGLTPEEIPLPRPRSQDVVRPTTRPNRTASVVD